MKTNISSTHTSGTQPHAYYALGLLLVAYILSFVDRNIMAMLIGPVRESFDISDFEFSLLHGFAFTLFYVILGLPIGRLADTHRRITIVSLGVFFWSIMTCLCGFAKSFASLFAARVGVGVGEAALSPPAYSLLADYFPPDKLRWATSVFAMGITLGSGLAYLIGGFVYEYFAAGSALPVLGNLLPWQATFVAVGLPGVVIALLIGALKEPNRRTTNIATANKAVPISEIRAHVRNHGRAYFALFAGISLMSIIGYGNGTWYPEFLQRTYGLSRTAAGSHLGAISIIAGASGSLFGAFVATVLRRRGYVDANLRTVGLIALVLLIPGPLTPLMPTMDSAIPLMWITTFIHYGYFGVLMAALVEITPSAMRAQLAAVMMFVANVFGLALGTSAIAAFTDFAFGDDSALRYSLSVTAALCYLPLAYIVFSSLRQYRAALLAEQQR